MSGRFIIAALLALPLQASAYSLKVNGLVTDHAFGTGMDHALIRVYKKGVKQHVFTTTANGRFSVVLDNGTDYVIRCSAPGFITKCFGLDTHGLVWEGADKVKALEVEVVMIEALPDLDLSLFDMPLGMLRFEPATGLVTWDKHYQEWIEPRIAAVMSEYDRHRAELIATARLSEGPAPATR